MEKTDADVKLEKVKDLLEDVLQRHFAGTIDETEKVKFAKKVLKVFTEEK